MARASRFSTRRLPDSLRSRLEVATARAWEALVETHATHAVQFVRLLGERIPLEETLSRYLLEMDLSDAMASAVKTRVLVAIEEQAGDEPSAAAELAPAPEAAMPLEPLPGGDADPDEVDDVEAGWRRFRPDVMVREYRERQRRDDQTEGWIKLALARAEEAVIATHVDNAITFAALLEELLEPDRAVQVYLEAVSLTGGRAQAAHQRTMARLADVHLPRLP